MDEVIKNIKERKELIDMNEEEKEAIETIRFLKDLKWYTHAFDNGTEVLTEEEKQDIDIGLNLIKKQQKELEKLETKNNDLLRKLRNRIKDVKKLQKYGQYKNEFSNLNKKIAKKDKIIDKMAEMLVEDKEWFYSGFDNYTKQDFIKYFTNLVEKENK